MKSICIGCLLIAALALSSHATPRELVIDVQEAPLAWADSELSEKIDRHLSQNPDLRLRYAGEPGNGTPSRPANRTDMDSLMAWGAEIGGRYLLVVTVDDESLERRKSFSLPVIFHKWEVVAVIRGEYRILDLQKRRLLEAKRFEETITGSRQFQGSTDDNRADPSLHLTATEKSRLFGRLEDKLAEQLGKRVARLTRGL